MSNDLGIDRSGNNNSWAVNNITYADQMLDSPTNNFCTLNPLTLGAGDNYNTTDAVLTEGNLTFDTTTGTTLYAAASTFSMLTGKWYAEVRADVIDGLGSLTVGIQFELSEDYAGSGIANTGEFASSWGYNSNGPFTNTNSAISGTYASYTVGDIIGIAIDRDNDKMYIAKNNTWQEKNPSGGDGASLSAFAGKDAVFACGSTHANRKSGTWNFGQDSSFAGGETAQGNADGNGIGDFYYTPPTGFLALCTSNLPEPAVIPSEHFNTVLWTGSSSEQAITGVGFQPDMVWIKCRNFAHWHQLFDAIRGVTKRIYPNETDAEATTAESLKSFDTDGYTMGTDGTGNHDSHSDTYVAWNWKANGSGSSNTNGTINTTATSANVDAGFSISTYTGDGNDSTIGHGLSKVPEMVIVKKRTTAAPGGARNWAVYHSSLATDKVLQLSTTSAILSEANFFREDLFSSSVFGCNGDYDTCYSGDTYVAYCFHSVDGYSKVGSWVGNGSTDGTFIYTGFRPAMIIWKVSTDVESWGIFDNVRDPDNRVGQRLHPESSSAESTASPTTGWQMDFTSNGFKWRGDTMAGNYDGETYIYLAFAETPFKYSNAR